MITAFKQLGSCLPTLAAPLALLYPATSQAGTWGEDWGQLLWGSTVSVPVPVLPGAVGLLLGAAMLAALWGVSRRAHLSRVKSAWLVVAIAVVPLASIAAPVVLPHTFTNGTVADADEVNSNFDTLVVESNDQDARLAALEGGEKTLKIPASALALGVGATYGLGGIVFPPGFSNDVSGTVPMPNDWDGTSDIVLKVLFGTLSSESAVVSFFVRVTGRSAGEVLGDPGSTVASGVSVSAFNTLHSQSFVVPASRFSPSDDVIHIYGIQRGGVGETSAANVALLAVELSYF